MCLEPEPEIDAEGYPVFIFHPDCNCRACTEQKSQHDSYTIEMIARVGRLHRQRCEEMSVAVSAAAIERKSKSIVYLKNGARTALRRWSPALPTEMH
jgi:hypothetical protein